MKRLLIVFFFASFVACQEIPRTAVSVSSITLTPTAITLTVGETTEILVTVLPAGADDKTVFWESSNPAVAIIKNGSIEAISAGTSRITAKVGGKSATCFVTVSAGDLFSVSLDKKDLHLVKGEKSTLVATILPDNAKDKLVQWTSSNNAVVTVSSSGEVTAMGAGSAIIIASVDSESAICTVDVSVPLESILFVPKEELFISDTNYHTLEIRCFPEDATISGISWTIEDESIIEFDLSPDNKMGTFRALRNGSTKVKLNEIGTGIEASIPVVVKVKATSIILGAEYYSYRWNSMMWQEIDMSYKTTYNVPLCLTIDVLPEIAYIDDVEITIEDDDYISFNAGGDDLVTKAKSGTTAIMVSSPYSGIRKKFTLTVKEYLSDAGVKNVQQKDNNNHTVTYMSFGGHIYSQVEGEVYYVNNVQFCDNTGRIIGTSMSPTEGITISRNGTNNVAFSTPYINMTQLYGLSVIKQDKDLDDFLSKCFFYVNYKKSQDSAMQARYIYLDPRNWAADYEY